MSSPQDIRDQLERALQRLLEMNGSRLGGEQAGNLAAVVIALRGELDASAERRSTPY